MSDISNNLINDIGCALDNEDLDKVIDLLKLRASIENMNLLLSLAISKNNVKIVKLLLDAFENEKPTSDLLRIALNWRPSPDSNFKEKELHQNSDIIHYLLMMNWSVNIKDEMGNYMIHVAAESGKDDAVWGIICKMSHTDYLWVMMCAICEEDLDKVFDLLKSPFLIEYFHRILNWAIYKNNPKIVNMLLDTGMDSMKSISSTTFKKSKIDPLHAALAWCPLPNLENQDEELDKNSKIISELLTNGWCISVKDEMGSCALHLAIKYCKRTAIPVIILMMTEQGLLINVANAFDPDIAKLLI